MVNVKLACESVASYLYILSYIQVQCRPPLWQLCHDLGAFNNGDVHVMKIIIAESVSDMDLLRPETCCFTPDVLDRAK